MQYAKFLGKKSNLYSAITYGEWRVDRLIQVPQNKGIIKND